MAVIMLKTNKISKFILKAIVSVIIVLVVIGFLFFWLKQPVYTPLEPKSDAGVQLVAGTIQDFRSATSTIYIKYPNQHKLVKTRATFAEDEGYALQKPNNSLHIEWIDEHHVSVTYQARQNPEPYAVIIEY